MQRIVSAYLDMAELQAMRRIPMTMQDWEDRLFESDFDRLVKQIESGGNPAIDEK